MKKKVFICVIMALALGWSASAQVEWGLRAGVSANWIPKTFVLSPSTKVYPYPAFYGGVTANFDISGDFIAHTELIYSGKGHSTKLTGIVGGPETLSNRVQLHYLQLPLLFGARLAEDRCYLAFGPEFGYLLGAKIKEIYGEETVTESIKEYCTPCNLALAFQTAYFFTDNLGLDLKLEWGITKTFKNLPYLGELYESKGHNTSVSIGLCYKFD